MIWQKLADAPTSADPRTKAPESLLGSLTDVAHQLVEICRASLVVRQMGKMGVLRRVSATLVRQVVCDSPSADRGL